MSYLCQAHTASLNMSYVGYFYSRKYNGFSMLWDGGLSTGKPIGQVPWGLPRKTEDRYTVCTGLWSRDGHIIHAPSWWYKDFPRQVPLQGEAWFNDSKWYASVCNSKRFNDERWRKLMFVVYNYKPYELFTRFDKDLLDEQHKVFYSNVFGFDHRLKLLAINVKPVENLCFAEQYPLTNDIDLGKLLYEVTAPAKGWEGLMLANPNAVYRCERTYDLLKLKPEYDIEVKIVGYVDGDGRNAGRMGALVVSHTWDDKVLSFHGGRPEFVGKTVRFNVGSGFTDAEREHAKDIFIVGELLPITFNEVGENGAIPSARYKSGR